MKENTEILVLMLVAMATLLSGLGACTIALTAASQPSEIQLDLYNNLINICQFGAGALIGQIGIYAIRSKNDGST